MDIASHASVAFDVVRGTWRDAALSPALRQGIVGNLLENLIRDRSRNEVDAILRGFDEFARKVLRSDAARSYLRSWRRGHFI